MQELWQVSYQILLIISQKELAKMNVMNVIIFLEYESVKGSLIKYKCLRLFKQD